MKIKYVDKRFQKKTLEKINQANIIIDDFVSQGFNVSLRQLYYQFVQLNLIPNTTKEYNNLGTIINNGRLAGLIDWDHLVDRGRALNELPHWFSAQHFMDNAPRAFRNDKWLAQDYHIEVWIEKDALLGIIEPVCNKHQVPFFSCRGYNSQSNMYETAKRIISSDQQCVILHLGDHDSSGIDMTRDIRERMDVFGADVTVERIALNMDQVKQYKPPPNPAKQTDPRAKEYIAKFGKDSWELDALQPSVIATLIEDNILKYRDKLTWDAALRVERHHKDELRAVALRWKEAVEFVRTNEGGEE